MNVAGCASARAPKARPWQRYVDATLGFRNHWYPAMFSTELAERAPAQIKLLGERLLINRIDGRAYAIKDRCLHRGVTLSDRLECHTKDTITCWYHGWTYRWDSGRLVDILTNPQSVQIGRHALKTYPVEEAQGVARRHGASRAVLVVNAKAAHAEGVRFYRSGPLYLVENVPAKFLSLRIPPIAKL